MREGWTYKKLEEVCEIICGQDYKNVESPDGKYPIYGTGGIMGYANQFKCPAYSIIVGRKGSINNPLYVEENFWNVDTAFGIVPSKDSLSSKFFYYYCKKYDFTKHNVAVTIPSLRRIDLLKIPVPVPPLSEQQRIVSELDLLSSIIEKKKAQLKEYDQLAQSIFYDMFGDPVANEKGWEVKKLGEIALVKTGPFGSMLHKEDYIHNGIPLINPIHMKDFHIIADMDFTISDEKAEELDKYILQTDDVIFARRGDIGRCAVVTEKENGYLCGTGSLFVRFVVEVASTYIMFIIRSSSFTNELVSNAKGATMLNLNSSIIEGLKLPLPPLPLQQSFASKIEAIERQKVLIQQSIAEVQMLFDSRMDDWFA